VAAQHYLQHYLMSCDHHFEDLVVGGQSSPLAGANGGQGSQSECDAKCACIATRNATPQPSASDSARPHKTKNPLPPFRLQRVLRDLRELLHLAPGRMPPKKQAALAMDGSAAVKVVGTGTEQTRFHSQNHRVVSSCDADCDAISAGLIELLARAVILVAGMRIPEAAREAVLARLIADLTSPTTQIPE